MGFSAGPEVLLNLQDSHLNLSPALGERLTVLSCCANMLRELSLARTIHRLMLEYCFVFEEFFLK